MSSTSKQVIKLSLVVAINNSDRGIGIRGKLPWRIPKDLKHFQKVTTRTVDSEKMNAVVMGRLTWCSIPKMARPLPKRLNVIISSTFNDVNKLETNENADLNNIILCKSFEEAIDLLTTKYADKIETIYAIGGASIYQKALECSAGFLDKIYLTRVYSDDTECDVFLEPANYLDPFEKLTDFGDNLYDAEFNTLVKEPGNNLEYCFEVYQKKGTN